ncbi:Rpn family recombination-promoting nuclease/putative transposase [Pedobacter heparinus]|uniref:Rpn family recombination-promoting nuclease/putative transposase n=1 Tax=Pedobacter heparinus TaxID=984 RepID=UPI00293059EC|nr:Rpn family recombination-promoting nuclease/putative transposase [Pedobacter heparinus]
MPKQHHQTTISKPDTKKVNSRYLNPKDDFAFKHIFTKETHLDLLMHFLNAVFKGKKVITKVQISKTEHKGNQKTDRKSVFDVHCTGADNEKFTIEMQKESSPYFADRLLFYAAILIQEQGKSVDANWNYKLPEIYFVAILDFKFAGMPADQYIHNVSLVETKSNLPFYKKLGYIYIELPGFNKTEKELKTDEDKWLFCIKHMGDLKDIPVSLKDDEIFNKLFKIAEVSNLTPAEMNAYQQSLKIKRDNYNHDQYILQQGEAKGEHKKAVEMALKLKHKNMPQVEIAELTGLTVEEIEAL